MEGDLYIPLLNGPVYIPLQVNYKRLKHVYAKQTGSLTSSP